MEEYQKRVMNEKEELDVKVASLTKFIKGPTFLSVSGDEQHLLVIQGDLMVRYSEILGKRIAAWK